jgi:hypothetical protein
MHRLKKEIFMSEKMKGLSFLRIYLFVPAFPYLTSQNKEIYHPANQYGTS